MIVKLSLILCLISCFIIGCTASKKHKYQINKPVEHLVYEFKDASKSPRYHRSYTISVQHTSANLIINSYGKTLYEETKQIDSTAFQNVLSNFKKGKIHTTAEKSSDGCTGGHTHIIRARDNDSTFFSGYLYECGKNNYGTLKGKTSPVIKSFKSIFPELSQRIQHTLSDTIKL